MKKKSLSNQQRIHRFRVFLAVLIAATIPCYCTGLILLKYYPQHGTETPTPTVDGTTILSTEQTPTLANTPTFELTPTATLTPKWTPSITYTPFLSPTATITLTPSQTPVPTETQVVDTLAPTNGSIQTQPVNPTEEVTP